MRLYYVVPRKWKERCLEDGILLSDYARLPPSILLVDRSAVESEMEAVRRRHGVDDVAVLVVSIPRAWYDVHQYGLRLCHYSIPPERIQGELFIKE